MTKTTLTAALLGIALVAACGGGANEPAPERSASSAPAAPAAKRDVQLKIDGMM